MDYLLPSPSVRCYSKLDIQLCWYQPLVPKSQQTIGEHSNSRNLGKTFSCSISAILCAFPLKQSSSKEINFLEAGRLIFPWKKHKRSAPGCPILQQRNKSLAHLPTAYLHNQGSPLDVLAHRPFIHNHRHVSGQPFSFSGRGQFL